MKTLSQVFTFFLAFMGFSTFQVCRERKLVQQKRVTKNFTEVKVNTCTKHKKNCN